jgi:hypothetical protein
MEKALIAEEGRKAELRVGTACAARVKRAGVAGADVREMAQPRLRNPVGVADGWRWVHYSQGGMI